MSTIRIEGADKLITKLRSLEDMKRVKASVFEAASMLKREIKNYPPEGKAHRPNPLLRGNGDKAKRMRAGFFYHLKQGNIDVPYRRGQSPGSEGLDKKWTIRMENYGFRGIIGNNTSYAQLVQDSAKQTAYHKQTGWQTTDDIVDKYGKQAINMIRQAFKQEVNS